MSAVVLEMMASFIIGYALHIFAAFGRSDLSLMSTSSEISSAAAWQSLPTPWQNPPIKTF